MREIVVDTETTGLSHKDGHRIVEIGCVELMHGMPTSETWHSYINPQRSMPDDAFAVHGLSGAFLSGKPLFAAVADEFLAFIGDAPLVMHNAAFDLGHLNAELVRAGRDVLDMARAVDTLTLARRKLPGKAASLDALCKNFGISLAGRETHGALKDALLLAQVYLGLQGGRQTAMAMSVDSTTTVLSGITPAEWIPLLVQPSEEEIAAHAAFIATIPNAIWHRKVI